jgi:hypothetical protein
MFMPSDVVGGYGVRWFWGLTRDFWAENAKNNFDWQ